MPRRAQRAEFDLREGFPQLYVARERAFDVVEVPPFLYLSAEGAGRARDAVFEDSVEALFGAAYALKGVMRKHSPGNDFVMMPLEALWSASDGTPFDPRSHAASWDLLVAVPRVVTDSLVREAVDTLARHRELRELGRVRLLSLREGTSVQTLHVGAQADEGPTILALRGAISEKGFTLAGRHHEIYLSDPRRAATARHRTILRQPVARARAA